MTGGKPWTAASQKALSPARSSPAQLLVYWGVVAAWMLLISLFSTEPFSAANTSRYIDPWLRYFFPSLSGRDIFYAHSIVRKSAHFVEFFVLGGLTFWACRRGRWPRWKVTWMLSALALAVSYSLADELHQALVPGRTASLIDSGIDSVGAAASQIIIYARVLWSRRAELLR